MGAFCRSARAAAPRLSGLFLRGTGSAEDARGEREQPLRSIPAWKASFLCHPPPQEDAAAQHAGSSAQRMRDLFL